MPHASPSDIPSLHLSRILHSGGDVSGEGEVSTLELVREPEVEGGEPERVPVPLAEPARWKATVSNVGGDEFWLSGRIEGDALVECSRCLVPTPVPVKAKLESLLRYSPKVETPRVEYGEDEQEVVAFGNPMLDLRPFLAEAVSLELPLSVLHAPDCRGLCATCGADLNAVEPGVCAAGRADCPHVAHEAATDPTNPFAKLKGLIPD